MSQTKFEDTNQLYMYKFRTKFCSMKGKCPCPATCFDAHSKLLKRRVPKLNEITGLWNYIPECCPQWRRTKNCSSGEDCPRSHGWLEVIYHPLLYKTKLCKSDRKDGICTEYGQYCAKAHNRIEVRSLVNLYGEDWKRHYDLSRRFGSQPGDAPRGSKGSIRRYKHQRNRVGVAVAPKSYQPLDINLFAGYLLEKQASMHDRSRKLVDQNLELIPCYHSDNNFTHPDAHSLELRSPSLKPFEANEGNFFSSPPNLKRELSNMSEQESIPQSAESKKLNVCDLSSPIQEEHENLWCDTDWLMLGTDSSLSDERQRMSEPNSDGHERKDFNCVRMPQNWFLSSCLEKATEVFTNRMS